MNSFISFRKIVDEVGTTWIQTETFSVNNKYKHGRNDGILKNKQKIFSENWMVAVD